MKRIKYIDAWGQVALIAGSLVFCIVQPGNYFFVPYFVVGGWQLFSMLIHDINHWFSVKAAARKRYHVLVYLLVCLMLLSYLLPPVGVIFWFLLFASPFMAVYYATLCFQEINSLQKRPLSQLK